MRHNKGKLSARERELMKRCLVLMAGTIFFFMLAAIRAMGGEYGHEPGPNPWAFPEEDEDAFVSASEQALASRVQRVLVGGGSMYHRRKASRVHDSVTIIIKESTSTEITSSNDLKRDSSNDMVLSSWLTPSLSGGLGTRQHGAAVGGSSPTISYSNSRQHKSDSSIDRTQSFTSTLTGEVIEVYPNGYLVIEARKRIHVNGEEQTLTVSGVVNPTHMNSDSAVKAEYLMDMTVRYTGSGPMTRMDKRGWGAKVIDFLNPF